MAALAAAAGSAGFGWHASPPFPASPHPMGAGERFLDERFTGFDSGVTAAMVCASGASPSAARMAFTTRSTSIPSMHA
jgi:hypothetical protein